MATLLGANPYILSLPKLGTKRMYANLITDCMNCGGRVVGPALEQELVRGKWACGPCYISAEVFIQFGTDRTSDKQ